MSNDLEPKKFSKDRGLSIAISLINELVNIDELSPTDRKLITDSLALLARIRKDKPDTRTKEPNPRKVSKASFKNCPICDCQLNTKNYDSHIAKVHGNRDKTIPKSLKSVKLISKRGTRLVGDHICSNCRIKTSNPTRYAQSNIGEVVLCGRCKPRVRNRSFESKKIDALDIATTGGGFETNRRRH